MNIAESEAAERTRVAVNAFPVAARGVTRNDTLPEFPIILRAC